MSQKIWKYLPDPARGFATVTRKPFRIESQVDVVAIFASFTMNVAKIVLGFIVTLPWLQVLFDGVTQRRVDEIVT